MPFAAYVLADGLGIGDIMLCSVLVGLAVMVLGILLLTLMSTLYIVPATVSVLFGMDFCYTIVHCFYGWVAIKT